MGKYIRKLPETEVELLQYILTHNKRNRHWVNAITYDCNVSCLGESRVAHDRISERLEKQLDILAKTYLFIEKYQESGFTQPRYRFNRYKLFQMYQSAIAYAPPAVTDDAQYVELLEKAGMI